MACCDKGPTFWSGYYHAQTSANSCYRTGMWYGRTRQCLPLLVFSSLTAASLVGLLLLPAVPQDQGYHLFADCRAVAGIPNFWNVVSNIPFIAIGAAGLWRFRDDPATIILFLGFFLTGIGSSYYHWHPNDATLFWDRLPMTLSFAAILSLGVAERVNSRMRSHFVVAIARNRLVQPVVVALDRRFAALFLGAVFPLRSRYCCCLSSTRRNTPAPDFGSSPRCCTRWPRSSNFPTMRFFRRDTC